MLAAAISGLRRNWRSRKRIGALGRPVVHPGQQAEREHVLRPLGLLLAEAGVLERVGRHAGQRHADQLPALQRAVLERVGRVADLRQVPRGELVGVGDEQTAAGQVGDVGLERGRVHHDQDVGGVARRHDVVVGEVQLEGADARQRARRRPDLGGEVGQRRQVVAEARRLAGEPVAGQLHAVAGVAGQPDDDAVELDDALHEAARRRSWAGWFQSSVVYLHRPRLRACVRGRGVDPDTMISRGRQPAGPVPHSDGGAAAVRRGNGDPRGRVGRVVHRWNNGLKTAVLLGLMGGLILPRVR